MKDVPGTVASGGVNFATTHWSVIAACTGANNEEAHAALTQLCCDYWPPLYTFVRRRGYSPADAQDLVQGFFAYFLRTKIYARADRDKGKFRTFLLASIKNYLADVWDRERALKRGGNYQFVLLEEEIEAAEIAANHKSAGVTLKEDQQFDRLWAAALVKRALRRLDTEFSGGPKERLFNELRSLLTGGLNLPTQEEIASRVDVPIQTLRSHLSRLRSRYRALLREEVARTVSQGQEIEEELRHLREVLASSC